MQQQLSIQDAAKAWATSPVGRLVRVEVLVTLSCALLVTLVFLSSGRRASRSAAFRLVVWSALMLSYPAVSYTIGLMQSAAFRNELVVVWACFLLGCADGIAACSSVDGSDQQARTMLNQAAQIMYVLFLLLSYPSSLQLQIKAVLFLFWVLNVVKLSMRLVSFLVAGSREHALAVENRFITGRRTAKLVLTAGEANPEDDGSRADVDLDMVEECDGALLSSDSWGGGSSRNLKDLCVSFALFKQLLRRFTGCYDARITGGRQRHLEFLTDGPAGDGGGQGHERAYRIIEMELGFLFDFFYARHPSLTQTLIPETLVFCAAMTLSLTALLSPALLFYHRPEGGAPAAVATGFDIWLTRLTIVMFVMVESFQYMTLLFSDWHKVSMACRYVRHPRSWWRLPILERLLGFICSVTPTTRYWSNSVAQYSLLGACLRSQNSLVARAPFLPKRIRGFLIRRLRTVTHNKDLPVPVKCAVYKVLPSVRQYIEPGEKPLYNIKHGISVIYDARMFARQFEETDELRSRCKAELLDHILEWSVLRPGIIRSLLIWHVATTICGYENETPQLEENQTVATTLSDYCSYLLFYATELVMENFHSTQLFLQDLQDNAQRCLVGCRSKKDIRQRLSGLDKKDQDKYKAILSDGIMLADQIEMVFPDSTAQRWKFLAEVWVEKLLSVTPSNNNLTAHTKKLATGGEYITHLWVFLTHKGILEPAPMHGSGGGTGVGYTPRYAEELV